MMGEMKMLYVPMLKLRSTEQKALKCVKECLSDRIIPLIEIIEDLYPTIYDVDQETGEILTEKVTDKNGKIRNRKKKKKPERNQQNTLEKVKELVGDKRVFIDYFRFHLDEYKKNNIDFNKVSLSLELRNEEYYKERLRDVVIYDNMIPVVSIKSSYIFSQKDLEKLVRQLKNDNHPVALRIHVSIVETYRNFCETQLGAEDYIMIDVKQDPVDSHVMELMEVSEWECEAPKIILNSPRDNRISTYDFEEAGVTALIDNSARELCIIYGLDGYGDYASYADKLPQGQQGRGEAGNALAFLYRYDVNGFEVFHNTSEIGVKGFDCVAQRVMEAEERLNPDGDCLGYVELRKVDSYRDWKLWIRIGIVRYIHQMYKYMD